MSQDEETIESVAFQLALRRLDLLDQPTHDRAECDRDLWMEVDFGSLRMDEQRLMHTEKMPAEPHESPYCNSLSSNHDNHQMLGEALQSARCSHLIVNEHSNIVSQKKSDAGNEDVVSPSHSHFSDDSFHVDERIDCACQLFMNTHGYEVAMNEESGCVADYLPNSPSYQSLPTTSFAQAESEILLHPKRTSSPNHFSPSLLQDMRSSSSCVYSSCSSRSSSTSDSMNEFQDSFTKGQELNRRLSLKSPSPLQVPLRPTETVAKLSDSSPDDSFRRNRNSSSARTERYGRRKTWSGTKRCRLNLSPSSSGFTLTQLSSPAGHLLQRQLCLSSNLQREACVRATYRLRGSQVPCNGTVECLPAI